jgi:hypothetical protein
MATSETADLNMLFGKLFKPKRVDPVEANVRPRSLQRLCESTAKWLKAFMKATEDGLGVTQWVYCELPILWVVDEIGDIWFAVEEIVSTKSHDFVLPRIRNTITSSEHSRLGHPALLSAGPGRIGGEILFDVRADVPAWFITNASGRYGLLPGRRPVHLANIAQRFREHGITLKEQFIAPRSSR